MNGYLIMVTSESLAYRGPTNIITVSLAQNSIQPEEGFKILKPTSYHSHVLEFIIASQKCRNEISEYCHLNF